MNIPSDVARANAAFGKLVPHFFQFAYVVSDIDGIPMPWATKVPLMERRPR